MAMPTEIDVTYRVVTPCFCAGTDAKRPELRVPSFKGVLRYWWRALAWSRCGADLAVLGRLEDRLFGSPDEGQSRVLMRLSAVSDPETVAQGTALKTSATSTRTVGEGARYLGYGAMEAFASTRKGTQAGELTRACFRPPFDFTVQMRGRGLREPELESLTDALIALGTLGGIGARSRKGYGSLVLRSLCVDGVERWRPPVSMAELGDAIGALRRDGGPPELPAFTALSGEARHVLVSSDTMNPVELLDLVGRELVRFRSWGHKGTILRNEQSERNFQDDHDLMKMDRRQRKTHPRRVAFGLPHNYGKDPDQQVGPADKDLDRRASPLFIHLHECDHTPVAVLSFLPARFLPREKADISVGRSRVRQEPETELYRPIREFLDRLLDPRKRKETFVDAMEVPR